MLLLFRTLSVVGRVKGCNPKMRKFFLVLVLLGTSSLLLSACGGSGGGSGGAIQRPATVNIPPAISGDPENYITQSVSYSFTPSASDPEGDSLRFEIRNKPGWATFDSYTGRLYGTPDPNDVGVYSSIRLSVTDGVNTVSLPRFSIEVVGTATGSVTLSWLPPTTNSDNTPLADLAGYKVYYGMSAGSYTNSKTIYNPGITSYVVGNLVAANWYFAVTAFDSSGNESGYSNQVNKSL